MKKFICILIKILVICCIFTSCDGAESDETTALITEEIETTAETTKTYETTVVPEATTSPDTPVISETTTTPETTVASETTTTPEATSTTETTCTPEITFTLETVPMPETTNVPESTSLQTDDKKYPKSYDKNGELIVYWFNNGVAWHESKECSIIKLSFFLKPNEGSINEAYANGKAHACSICSSDSTVVLPETTSNLEATNTPETSLSSEVTSEPNETSSVVEELSGKDLIDWFVSEYNMTAPTPITNVSEIDVTDKTSKHYKTEFRLSAFKNSYSVTGKIGSIEIDIVTYGWGKNDDIRLYIDNISLEHVKTILKYASVILDDSLTGSDIQEVLDYLDKYKSANGYYYGNICIVYTKDLMIKVE